MVELALIHGAGRHFEVVFAGCQQQHAVFVGFKLKGGDVACAGCQWAVEAVDDVAQLVVDGVELVAAVEQAHLVVEPLLDKHCAHIGSELLASLKGDVAVHDFAHAFLDVFHYGRSDGSLLVLEVAKIAPANGVLHNEPATGIEVVDGLVENHAQRVNVDSHATCRVDANKFHLLGAKNGILQVFGFVVHSCRYHAFSHLGLQCVVELLQCVATGHVDILVGVFAIYFDVCTHSFSLFNVDNTLR